MTRRAVSCITHVHLPPTERLNVKGCEAEANRASCSSELSLIECRSLCILHMLSVVFRDMWQSWSLSSVERAVWTSRQLLELLATLSCIYDRMHEGDVLERLQLVEKRSQSIEQDVMNKY